MLLPHEVNRLREEFRNDLPLYQMPQEMKPRYSTRKRKLTGNVNPTKKVKLASVKTNKKHKKTLPKPVHTSPNKRKRSESLKCDDNNLTKRSRTSANECGRTLVRKRCYQSRFTPVNEHWQCTACHNLGLRFVRKCDLDEGGPDVPLTQDGVSSQVWTKMRAEQRRKVVSAFEKAKLPRTSQQSSGACDSYSDLSTEANLSVSAEDSGISSIPLVTSLQCGIRLQNYCPKKMG